MKRVKRHIPYLNRDLYIEMIEDEGGEWVSFADIPSWDMLMDILDAVYPASVFTGVSGDTGPQIVVKLREIDALRRGPTGDAHE